MRVARDLRRDEPAVYRICLNGALDESWSDMLSGMVIATNESTEQPCITTLTGSVADQAALIGVLNLVYSLGMTVLLVECEAIVSSTGAPSPDLQPT